jgi:hypothetical protein
MEWLEAGNARGRCADNRHACTPFLHLAAPFAPPTAPSVAPAAQSHAHGNVVKAGEDVSKEVDVSGLQEGGGVCWVRACRRVGGRAGVGRASGGRGAGVRACVVSCPTQLYLQTSLAQALPPGVRGAAAPLCTETAPGKYTLQRSCSTPQQCTPPCVACMQTCAQSVCCLPTPFKPRSSSRVAPLTVFESSI